MKKQSGTSSIPLMVFAACVMLGFLLIGRANAGNPNKQESVSPPRVLGYYGPRAASIELTSTVTPTAAPTITVTPIATPTVFPEATASSVMFLPNASKNCPWSPPPPPASYTYYVQKVTKLLKQGKTECQAERGDVFVILDFGDPYSDGVSFGSTLFDAPTYTYVLTPDIIAATEQYIGGYYYCALTHTGAAHLTLAIGTTNHGAVVTSAHGEAWGKMVKEVGRWISSPPSWDAKVAIAGANDMELNWKTLLGILMLSELTDRSGQK